MSQEIKEIKPTEFFEKNKQMLGFTGKIRSLTIVFHELITNSLDACEQNNILPEIEIELKSLRKNHYLLKHKDNGPGIPEKYIEQVYCVMFAGSKFTNKQTRGQQGLGASGCVLLSQITTGKTIKIKSGHMENGELKGVEIELRMNIEENKGEIIKRKEIKLDKTGVEIELEYKNLSYTHSEQGAFEYIRRTIIGNPHAQILFTDPTGKTYKFKRASEKIPEKGEKILPHPKGIITNELYKISQNTEKLKIKTMLKEEISRISEQRIKELEEKLNIDLKRKPKTLKWEECEEIVETFKEMKFMRPSAKGIIPIGEKQIKKGMEQILKPEFIKTIERKVETYNGGIPFIAEIGLSYGGNSGKETKKH